jgi:DHA2 family multidrug resistance protein
MCWRRGPAPTGSAARDRHRRLVLGGRLRAVHGALVPLARAYREADAVPKPTFVFACVFNLVIGFGIYSSTYLIPSSSAGCGATTAMEIGTTVVVTGCAQLFSVPSPRAPVAAVDQRIVIGFGLSLFALGLWLTSHMTPEWGFASFLFWPQVVRSFAIMLCIVPSVPRAERLCGPELRYASGLFNLMRNLGGAIGIALVNTWLQDICGCTLLRCRRRSARSASGEPKQSPAGALSARSRPTPCSRADDQATLGRIVGREALTLAFNDVFRLMAWLFLAALVWCPSAARAPADAH